MIIEDYCRYECGIIDILYQSDIGVWILAFRALTSARSPQFFVENDFKNVVKNNVAACDADLDDFDRLCRLVTHEGSERFSAPELMKEAMVGSE
jgi:hypothetical protein